MSGKENLAASVSARLLNRARQTGADYQTLLTSYCLERLLYRLSVSDRCDRFVLKGAMLLRVWADQPYRATRDLDLLRRGDGAFEAIRDDLMAIVAKPVPDDAVTFDAHAIKIEAMVVLGDRNSRIKDFFDVHYLASHFEFDRAILSEAIRRTFERRRTPMPQKPPIALTPEYWKNPTRPTQMQAFLTPLLNDLRDCGITPGSWSPGGPWK